MMSGDHAVPRLELFPVHGIGEVRPGDDLAALILERAELQDGDVGVAGVTAVNDPRGEVDAYGNHLETTRIAIADELAAAADLVKGKLGGLPVAVVRGLAPEGKLADDGRGARPLLRGAEDDM